MNQVNQVKTIKFDVDMCTVETNNDFQINSQLISIQFTKKNELKKILINELIIKMFVASKMIKVKNDQVNQVTMF